MKKQRRVVFEPYRQLTVDLGTLIYDKEYPEDMGMIVGRDEKKELYKIHSMTYACTEVPDGWYEADYVEKECLPVTPAYTELFNKRMKDIKLEDEERRDREFYEGL